MFVGCSLHLSLSNGLCWERDMLPLLYFLLGLGRASEFLNYRSSALPLDLGCLNSIFCLNS